LQDYDPQANSSQSGFEFVASAKCPSLAPDFKACSLSIRVVTLSKQPNTQPKGTDEQHNAQEGTEPLPAKRRGAVMAKPQQGIPSEDAASDETQQETKYSHNKSKN
jgi:hypothetical protein